MALLWKMADEPILCFDGDKAGQRAAFRAVDMALPRSEARQEPALRACCPTGRTPTISYRSGGREAIAEVLARRAAARRDAVDAARPKAASFDTPERRAAFEARVHEVARSIGDEVVRKYYARISPSGCAQLLAPRRPRRRAASGRAGRGNSAASSASSGRSGNVRDFARRRECWQRGGPPNVREPIVASRARGCRRARSCAVAHRAAAARGADPASR